MSMWQVKVPIKPTLAPPEVLPPELMAQMAGWLLDTSIKGTLVLAGGWLLSRWLRGASARQRHLLWALTFLALCCVPWSTWVARGQLPALAGASGWVSGAIVGVWALGVCVVLAPLLLGALYLRTVRQKADLLDDAEWKDCRDAFPPSRRLRQTRVYLSDAFSSPMTWGWWKPVILLPGDWDTWKPLERRSALLHELAHITRWDWCSQLWVQLTTAFFWFHPLAWLARSRFLLEAEKACDDRVLLLGIQPSMYASMLVERCATMLKRKMILHSTCMSQPSQLGSRVTSVLDKDGQRNRLRLSVSFFALALFALLTWSVSAKSIFPKTPPPQTIAKKTSAAAPKYKIIYHNCTSPAPVSSGMSAPAPVPAAPPLLYTPASK